MASIDRDQFLIELYRLFPGAPPAEFSDAALRILKLRLHFDSALWGTFALTPEGPHQHTVHLHGLPMEMLRGYQRVHAHNLPYHAAAARPGRTVNLSMDRVAAQVHPSALAFGRRWGLLCTLTTLIEERALNLFSIVALYRNDLRRPFSESERRFKQSVAPHLVAAWRMNALHFLDEQARPTRALGRARALVAPLGEISLAEPTLAELLRAETREWHGPMLPEPLLPLVRGETDVYCGNAVVAALERRLEDGAVVISVRRRVPLDELSSRELQVAREFASGKSHKEIASLLGTSPATVRSQIQSAYRKLGVDKKVDLLRRLEESG